MPSTYLPLAVATAGVASHLFYFKSGEHYLYTVRYIQIFLLACTTATVTQVLQTNTPTPQAVVTTARYALLYLVGVYSSVITYRLFFNPLNKFPGPFWARLSRFHLAWTVGRAQRLNYYLLAMHQKHGRFVRLDPNTISVTHPDAIEATLGPSSKCSKSEWYQQDWPRTSLHSARTKAIHDRRRSIWSPAFSDKALRGYENRVQKYNDLLESKLAQSDGQPLNMSKYFNLYSFDVMGDLAFGAPYGGLEKGELHWAMKVLSDGLDMLGIQLPPWIFRLLLSIPGAATDFLRMAKSCADRLEDRMKIQGQMNDPDITHTLIEHYNKVDQANKASEWDMMEGDSRLIIIAGSDTTAATLSYLFYHIATQKGLLQRLRDELDDMVTPGEKIESVKIQDVPILNGSINEALRLNPPVPSGVFRKTPSDGIEIDGVHIPGNTVVQMPQYVMARDPDLYPQALDFIPERHTSRAEELMPYKSKEVFHPFSTGPYGCIGKKLAYMEVRLLTAQIIRKFDVALAPGEDGQKLLMETKDHFTLGLQPIQMCFTPRKG